MINYKIIWRLLFLLFFYQPAKAQPVTLPGYTIQTFGAGNGLASTEILSLFQDEKDFIWIGTRNGISLYDGKEFQNFEYINNIPVGAVYSITEDNKHTLWMSSETGLYYQQGKTFVHCSFEGEAAYLPFRAIHFSSGNEAWIGTARGPAKMLSPQTKQDEPLKNYILPGWQTVAFDDGSINFIHSSKQGVVFGAFNSVYLYQNKELRKLPNPIVPREFLRAVFIDDAGIVYWSNIMSGFHYWNGKETVKPLPYNGYFFDIIYKKGKMLLYSNAGIMQVDADTKRFSKLTDLEPLELRMPTCLLIDNEGAYWAGATEGLFRIKKNYFTVYTDKQFRYADDVYSLLRRRNGELLMGANRGRIFIMKDSLRPYANALRVVLQAEVFSMYEDSAQSLWFGTGYQGIALYKDGKLKNFTKNNGLPDNSHYAFYKSIKGELWSAGDMGLTLIEKTSKKDSFMFRPFFYKIPIGYHKLYGIIEAPDGTIWAGGQLGLFYIDADSLRTYTLPELSGKKIFITAIKKDKQGRVWISTRSHGILLCSFDNHSRLHLQSQWREEDGLPSNTYLSIAFDEKNNVWAGSYSGVTALQQLTSDTFYIKNFDVRDGFINKSYQSLGMFADGGTMWVCTSSGAVSFVPASLLSISRKAQLHINSIDLLNTKKSAGEFLNNHTGIFKFPYNFNSFSIKYAALYYSNPDAIRYFYQLQNIDSQWVSAGSDRAILFRHLPPGNYRLLIKASIGGNDYTNTATFLFEIKKPWWLQWWVIFSAFLLAGSVILYYSKSREKTVRQKEQQKTAFEKLKANTYQHQLEIEQVINYFSSSLSVHTSIDGVLWDVARNCISRLGFEDCVIYLKDDEKNVLVQKAAWGPKTTEENKIINPIEIPLGKGIVGSVALSGKPEKIDDTSLNERYIVDDVRRFSEITVPIFDEGKVIGIIDSEHSEKNFYTNRHLQILTTIALQCGARITTIKAEAKSKAARIEVLENKQKALEASLQSMRLQMNPHFLFNVLNSIQQMILSGDETTATRFLSKFSKLLRLVLTKSDKEEISLKEDLEILHLYVELESLRFKKTFSYSITCDTTVDTEETYVPSLFLQPFVENAIWHGLMHKEGERKLQIDFNESIDGALLCSIEDNGIGRAASAEKSNNSREQHTGRGLSLARERIRTLNEKNGTKSILQIIDIKDKNKNPCGTRIEIKLYPWLI